MDSCAADYLKTLARHLTVLLDPGDGSVLGEDHLTELVSDEAEDVLGCGSVQVALLHHPGVP